ncbi:DASH complex subunit dam1 [Coemansia thaxteri]|uniref:DASH complex subunit DAM1 n=1 Tax=Coemansia thaxteri TaxID=2663907 RepID=A0A9W8EER3_9FUNG|nr:DASH complex subunit dam1 [Coemansia thaxteri]KAJ2002211.1 DASH complex subunit dam1 [Coemansia thaxteri]KAJ2465257.1 DASH complex subunit dam1 [Coemansia sp. RSA 2322]KAJ2478410.1 DASH complex subunit dam1 [Coemansia sp. RSA 2320]
MSTRRLSIYPNSQSFEDNLFELQRNFSALATNLRELDSINNSLLSFNRNFSVFLQGLRLNSECLEFPEAPNADSYALAQRQLTPPPAVDAPCNDMDQMGHGDSHMMGIDDYQASEEHRSAGLRQHHGAQQTQAPALQKKRVVIKAGGVKRRKPAFQPRRIMDLLPSRFKDQPHKSVIEQILKELNMSRDGMYAHEIVRDVGGGLTRNKCADYMNALVQTDAVKRVNKKGHLFFLDPDQFPL